MGPNKGGLTCEPDAAGVLSILARPCRMAFSVADMKGSDTRDDASRNLADVGVRRVLGLHRWPIFMTERIMEEVGHGAALQALWERGIR